MLGPPGAGRTVGASEYGGPGDPSSGTIGSSGASLLAQPDSYAELGGDSFQAAVAMGGLPYGTLLRVTWAGHRRSLTSGDSAGLGGPGAGQTGTRGVIDLWWQFAK